MQLIQSKTTTGIILADDLFDKEAGIYYHLSLELAQEGLLFTLLDIKRNKYIFLKTHHFQHVYNVEMACNELANIVNEEKLLQQVFRTVSLSIVTPKFTLVPSALFDQNKRENYLNFNSQWNESEEEISSNYLKNLQIYNVFALPNVVKNTTLKLFPNAKIYHQGVPLLESVVARYKNQENEKVIVHVQASHLEIIVLEGKKLIFFNTFNYKTSEDFIYYILFTCEQLKLNPEELHLTLIGEIKQDASLYVILNKYIRNIHFGLRPDNFEYSEAFEEIPKHFYFNLFSQYLCV